MSGRDQISERADGRVGPTSVPTPLEIRYRRLLSVLPAGYRRLHGQEMIDTFVRQSIDADPDLADLTLRTGWPSLRETVSVLTLAARVRWAGVRAHERAAARRHAVQTATMAALVVLAGLATSSVLGTAWYAAHHPDAGDWTLDIGSLTGVWSTVQAWSYVLWLAALAAAIVARPRLAQAAMAVPLITTLVGIAQSPDATASSWTSIVIHTAVLIGLSAFEPDLPAPYRRRWIAAGCTAIALGSAMPLIASAAPDAGQPLAWTIAGAPGLWCAASMIAAALLLASTVSREFVTSGSLLAVAALASTAVLLRAAEIADWARYLPADSIPAPLLASAIIQQAIDVAIAAVAGVLGIVMYRRLPSDDYRTAAGG